MGTFELLATGALIGAALLFAAQKLLPIVGGWILKKVWESKPGG